MANPIKGQVSFEAAGQAWTFCLSNNAQCVLEAELGLTMVEVAKRLEQGSVVAVRAIFWAGLTDHHPDIDVKSAGRMIDELGPERVGEIIARGFQAAEGPPMKPGRTTKGGPATSPNGSKGAVTQTSSGA